MGRDLFATAPQISHKNTAVRDTTFQHSTQAERSELRGSKVEGVRTGCLSSIGVESGPSRELFGQGENIPEK